jgi:hypothetical protein
MDRSAGAAKSILLQRRNAIATVIMELKGISRKDDRLSYFCQALGPDFGVRHSCVALFGCSLVLSCFRGQANSKAAQGRRSPKMLRNHKIQNPVLSHYLSLFSPFRLTNLLYVKREKSGDRSQETEWEPENQKQLRIIKQESEYSKENSGGVKY